MLVHCKYTHFLPHCPRQFDFDWLFVEHAHFCSCQMSCPSCFSGTSGPCCHMFFIFFPWLMKGGNSVVCVHVGLCGWLVHSFAKAAAVLCMLLLLFQAQFLEALTLCCECSLVIWRFKVQLCGCRERFSPLYFTDGGCTAARRCILRRVHPQRLGHACEWGSFSMQKECTRRHVCFGIGRWFFYTVL